MPIPIDWHAQQLCCPRSANSTCQIAFQTKARSWQPGPQGGFAIKCGDDDTTIITCRKLIICGGLHASDFANAGPENSLVPATQYAKGNYFRLQTNAPFSHLIYPVPEPGGLGVHLTLDMNRQARFGPDVEWVDKIDYEVAPARSEKFYAAIRDYWPDLADDSLVPDYSGIRPKLVGPGEPNADFKILQSTDHGFEGLTVLLGIESPGLTASLALAELV